MTDTHANFALSGDPTSGVENSWDAVLPVTWCARMAATISTAIVLHEQEIDQPPENILQDAVDVSADPTQFASTEDAVTLEGGLAVATAAAEDDGDEGSEAAAAPREDETLADREQANEDEHDDHH